MSINTKTFPAGTMYFDTVTVKFTQTATGGMFEPFVSGFTVNICAEPGKETKLYINLFNVRNKYIYKKQLNKYNIVRMYTITFQLTMSSKSHTLNYFKLQINNCTRNE